MWKVTLPTLFLLHSLHKRSLYVGATCSDSGGSYRGKTCAWVAERPNLRCDFCSEDGNVCAAEECKQTCNTCPPPFEVCEEGEWVRLGSKIRGEDSFSQSGNSISISADGKTLAIGAEGNTPDGDYSIYQAGHVRVYSYDQSLDDWVQLGGDIDGEEYNGLAGYSVSLSDDGLTVALGAPYVNNDAGQVQVYFFKSGIGDWIQLGGDLLGEYDNDKFGYSVALSGDGKTVAGGDDGDVRVFYYDELSSDWVQRGNGIDGGVYTKLSDDGKTVSVNSFGDNAVKVYSFDETDMEWNKVGSDIADDGKSWFGMDASSAVDVVAVGDIGAEIVQVHAYDESSSTWLQLGTDIDGPDGTYFFGSFFGRAVSLSGDGKIVAAGASNDRGSVTVLKYDGTLMDWVQIGDKIVDNNSDDSFGSSLSISSDGQILAIGAKYDDCFTGAVEVFKYVCD